VLPPGRVRYQLALGEVAVQPVVQANPAPSYPPELIAQALPPMEFTTQVIVNTQGTVDDVRVADAAGDPAARIAAAIRQSMRQWRFSPLTITHWAADAAGNQHQVDSENKPFSQS
jgi:outer membrane biosynthesis protein TonB